MAKRLSHLDEKGHVRMVDVSAKSITTRRAVAEGRVKISRQLAKMISSGSVPKGDLLAAVRLAGIQGAKKTSELIPLCHNLPLEQVDVQASVRGSFVKLRATVICVGRTGVEMEALTAVAVAALTVVDMGKAIDPAMVIGPIQLVEKTGGKTNFRRRA
ncbi:MAG: cyclic pyranopterin monophosphate synthase MoaC [Tepidisphaeraceae bacterium]|jgi:cyclic pyranopterin phosphate synthase